MLPLSRLALVLALCAHADTVFLRNGNRIEGIVSKETDTEVEVEIGAAITTLPKSSVLRIARSSGADRRRLDESRARELFDSGGSVPKSSKDVFAAYQEILKARDRAERAKARKEKVVQEQDELRDRLPGLQGSGLSEARARLNELDPLLSLVQRDVADYASAVGRFRRRLAMLAKPEGSAEREFRKRLDEALGRLDSDFEHDAVPLERRGNSLIVQAMLDGRVAGRFILDTGAAYTTVSPELARRLRPLPGTDREGIRTMADGRKVSVRSFQISSMDVGNSRLERVAVDILPAAEPSVDGLLGMSFLNAFQVQLEGDRLRLSRLAAASTAAPPVFGGPSGPARTYKGDLSDYHWSDDAPHNDRSLYPWVRTNCQDPDSEYARLDDAEAEQSSTDETEVRGASCADIKAWKKSYKQDTVRACLKNGDVYGYVYRYQSTFYWDGQCGRYIGSGDPFLVDLRKCDRILVNPRCVKYKPSRCYKCRWGCAPSGQCYPEPPHAAPCASKCRYGCDFHGNCHPKPTPCACGHGCDGSGHCLPAPKPLPPEELPPETVNVQVPVHTIKGTAPAICPVGEMMQDGRCKGVEIKTKDRW